MTGRLGKIIQLILFFVGIFILTSIVGKVGWQSVINNLLKLNWWFIPVLFLNVLWYLLYTKGWQHLLKPFSGNLSVFELFRAKLAGEAINSINPAGFMVGDPVRIYLLKENFPVKEGAASVVVDRTIHSLSVLFVILVGIIVGFPILDFLPREIQLGVPIFFGAMSALLFLIILFQRKGIFVMPFKLLLKLNIKRDFALESMSHMEELDQNIRTFYGANREGFWIALIYHFVGRSLGIFEIFIFGIVISSQFTFRMAILLGALGPIVNATFAFLPGALGVMEGAYSGLIYILGLDPAVGMAIQIARRIRALFWIIVGLVFITLHKRERALA